jgi:hypothetical protein
MDCKGLALLVTVQLESTAKEELGQPEYDGMEATEVATTPSLRGRKPTGKEPTTKAEALKNMKQTT